MIHQYKLGDYNIVLDVCSGSVHAVDEVAYDMIALFENEGKDAIIDKLLKKYSTREDVTKEDLSDCYDQILGLKADGKLFAPETGRTFRNEHSSF